MTEPQFEPLFTREQLQRIEAEFSPEEFEKFQRRRRLEEFEQGIDTTEDPKPPRVRPITSTGRKLDIGFATFGDEMIAARGSTIGLDPEASTEIQQLRPGFIQVAGIAENLPFGSNTLDRVTSSNTVGSFTDFEESIEEIVRVLRPGGTARIGIESVDVDLSEIRGILKKLPVTNIRVKRFLVEGEEFEDFVLTFRKAR